MPPHKPFLLLSVRSEAAAADGEYESVRRFGGLGVAGLERISLASGSLPVLNLRNYSGIIIGGSPFNVSDDAVAKSELQVRVEAELQALLAEVIALDYPLLGLCYGMGLLGQQLGGVVNRQFGEPAGAITVTLTPLGLSDPLLDGLPSQFEALTGHKGAVAAVPPGAVLLASSETAPVQILRVGTNVYAVQFHPELDQAGLKERLSVYLDKGYCAPDEFDSVVAQIQTANLASAHQILKNFTTRYVQQ